MSAVWNIYEIAEMGTEEKVRNICRQLRQECREWNRPLGYHGRTTRKWQDLPKGITLLCGGRSGRQWVQIEVDHKPVGRRFSPATQAGQLYGEIMHYADLQVTMGAL